MFACRPDGIRPATAGARVPAQAGRRGGATPRSRRRRPQAGVDQLAHRALGDDDLGELDGVEAGVVEQADVLRPGFPGADGVDEVALGRGGGLRAGETVHDGRVRGHRVPLIGKNRDA